MSMLLAKGLGALLALAGFLLAVLPGLMVEVPVKQDRFAAIETRTRFGAVGGFGLGLSLLPALSPWTGAMAFLAFWTTVGFLSARVIGLVLDGYHVKQMIWIAIESVVAGSLAYYLWG